MTRACADTPALATISTRALDLCPPRRRALRRRASAADLPRGAAGPQRPVDRGLVELVADQHQLGAPRAPAPVAVVPQLGADPGTFDEAAARLAREVHEALGADQPIAERL